MPVLSNAKHELFAQAVAGGSAAGAAYLKIYQCKGSVAETNGPKLHRKVQIKARVVELQSEGAKKVTFDIEAALTWCVEVIQTPIGAVDQNHPLCQEHSRTEGEHSTSERFKMPSKMDALREIAKLRGWYEADKSADKAADALTGIMQAIAKRGT